MTATFKLRSLLPLAAALGLAACAGSGEPDYSDAPDYIGNALCTDDAATARQIVDAWQEAEPMDPVGRLFNAYLMERRGDTDGARRLYSDLSASGSDAEVEYECGEAMVLYGEVADVARYRLRDLDTRESAIGSMIERKVMEKTAEMEQAHKAEIERMAQEQAEMQAKREAEMAAEKARKEAEMEAQRKPMMMGHFWVQLASYRDAGRAERAIGGLMGMHGATLGHCEEKVSRANLGRRGIFYRVGCGGYGSLAEARGVCRQLKMRGQDCLPARMPN